MRIKNVQKISLTIQILHRRLLLTLVVNQPVSSNEITYVTFLNK